MLNLQSTLMLVHNHFIVEGHPPSADPGAPGFAAFHGMFNGEQSCCAIGVFDPNRLLEGHSFAVESTDQVDDALLDQVFDTPVDKASNPNERAFLELMQHAHDVSYSHVYSKMSIERVDLSFDAADAFLEQFREIMLAELYSIAEDFNLSI